MAQALYSTPHCFLFDLADCDGDWIGILVAAGFRGGRTLVFL